jgi:hypothetical protein
MRRRYGSEFSASLTVVGEVRTLRVLPRFSSDWFVFQLFLLLAGPADGYAVSMAFNTTIAGVMVGLAIGLVGLYAPSSTSSVEQQRWIG